MALELFVQLLEICGIKFEFFSRSNLFPRIAYHSLTFQIVTMELNTPTKR